MSIGSCATHHPCLVRSPSCLTWVTSSSYLYIHVTVIHVSSLSYLLYLGRGEERGWDGIRWKMGVVVLVKSSAIRLKYGTLANSVYCKWDLCIYTHTYFFYPIYTLYDNFQRVIKWRVSPSDTGLWYPIFHCNVHFNPYPKHPLLFLQGDKLVLSSVDQECWNEQLSMEPLVTLFPNLRRKKWAMLTVPSQQWLAPVYGACIQFLLCLSYFF